MASFAEALRTVFGGSETTQVSKPVDLTPPEFSALRGPFSAALTSTLNEGAGPQYEGPLNAPITAPETAALGNIQAQTGPGTARSNYLQDVIGGKYLDEGNPFLQSFIEAAQRPTLQGLEETLSRALPGRFTAAGHLTQPQGSSAFDRAAALATRGASQSLADIATNISYGAYEGERNRQQQAVPLDQAEVDASVKNLQAQALPRLIEEVGIERGIQLFQSRINSVLQTLQLLAGVTAPVIGQQTTAKSVTNKGIFPAGLGGAGGSSGTSAGGGGSV